METFLYLFIHYGLPFVLIIYVLRRTFKSKIGLIATTAFSVSIVFFLYLWGQWAIVGSYYLRYLIILAIIFLFYLYAIKKKSIVAPHKAIGIYLKIRIALTGLLTLLVLFFTVQILFANNNYKYDAVELEFPLQGATYYISSGGSNNLMNNHLRDYQTPQQYAVDINKLNSFKSISKRPLSKDNSQHYIFSDTVYCPCNGIIKKVKNKVKDNLMSSMNVSSKNGKGNFVYLKCDEIYIYMMHLKMNSVLVSKGDVVKSGLPIGLVGNSGFSQEPHLHIQASKYVSDSTMVGVPIKFNGNILTKNDLINN